MLPNFTWKATCNCVIVKFVFALKSDQNGWVFIPKPSSIKKIVHKIATDYDKKWPKNAFLNKHQMTFLILDSITYLTTKTIPRIRTPISLAVSISNSTFIRHYLYNVVFKGFQLVTFSQKIYPGTFKVNNYNYGYPIVQCSQCHLPLFLS